MRKNKNLFTCIVFILLAFLLSQSVYAAEANPPDGWQLFFFDDFSNNQYNWPVWNDEDNLAKYDFQVAEGKYRWSFHSKGDFWFYNYPQMGQVSDFYTSFTGDQTNYIQDSSYGIVFRHVDEENFYYLRVEPQYQYFAVFVLYNNTWQILHDWEYSSAIQPNQANEVAVLGQGNDFTFYVNRKEVATLTNSLFDVGYIALAAEMYESNQEEIFLFDDFTIHAPTYTIPSDWIPVFEDTFDANEHNWYEGELSDPFMDASIEITDGVYQWEMTRREDFIHRREPDTVPISDFYISTDLELTSSTEESVGRITFRASSSNEHYAFGINPNYQTYSFMVFAQNDWVTLTDWAYSPTIQPTGVNNIAVLAEGSRFYCFINGQLVTEADSDHLRHGMPGLAVEIFSPSAQATYQFDNFKILIPQQGEFQLSQALELFKSGNVENAEAIFNETISYYQRLEEDKLVADTLETIGMAYADIYQYDTALTYYQRSLEIRETLKSNPELLETLQLIEAVYYLGLDDFRSAIEINSRITELSKELDNPYFEAESIHRLGIYHFYLSEYERAIFYTQQAIEMREQLDDKLNLARGYNNIGGGYAMIGDYERAIEYFQEAITITEEINDNSIRPAIFTNNLGDIYETTGDLDTALKYYLRANELFNNLDDEPGFYHAGNLDSLASIYIQLSEMDKALDALDQAWEIMEGKMTPFTEAFLLLGYGHAYFEAQDYEQALDYLNRALFLFQQVGNRDGAIEALEFIGEIYELQGEDAAALESYLQAIEEHEATLAGTQSEEFKSSISGTSASIYQKAIRLLFKSEQYEEAFLLSERNRARVFLEGMGNNRPELIDPDDTKTLRQEEKIRGEITALEKQLQTEKDKPLIEIDSNLVQALHNQLSQAQNQYQDFITQLQTSNPELATLVSVPEMNLTETQSLLDENNTIISYYLTDTDALAFVITQDGFDAIKLPADSEEIHAEVKVFRGLAMSNLNNTQPRSLVTLYEWLITPLLPYISTSQVGIIPNQSLHYIPFSALTDGANIFGAQYTLFYLPSVNSYPFIISKQDRTVESPLVLGNPITENPNLAELSYAAQEAQAVAELFGVQPSLEDQATEQVVKTQSSSAGILHLAAHGSLNPYTPLFSRLWLTPQGEEDGRLNVYEIFSLNLSKVNLVVLSACQTQLGEVSAGDEIVSLNRAFLYSTPTVVASLWSVDDEASGYFMEQFYKNLIQGGSKAQALQNAQAAVRENTDHPEWQHPYYWASFVLNGDPGSGSIMTSQNGQNPTPPEFQMPSLYKIGAVVLVTLLLLILLVTYLKKKGS